MGLENFLRVNSFDAFQPISGPTREERMKEVEVERVERVERIEEISVQEEKDCEIIGTSKKRGKKSELVRFRGISTYCFEGGDGARV